MLIEAYSPFANAALTLKNGRTLLVFGRWDTQDTTLYERRSHFVVRLADAAGSRTDRAQATAVTPRKAVESTSMRSE